MNIALWVLQVLLALAFVMAGFMKASRPLEELGKMMTWVPAITPGLVRFIGVAELLGGIGLIVPALTGILPWLTVLAALGLAVAMLLAAIFHIVRREFQTLAPSLVLLLLSLAVVYGRLALAPLTA